MRNTFTNFFAIAILAVAATAAQATPIITINAGQSTGGLNLFTFGIDNADSDEYDTIDVTILADAGTEFLNPRTSAIFTAPGGDDTAFLGTTTVATGLALVGIEANASRLSGVITSFSGPSVDQLNDSFAQVVGAAGLSVAYTIKFALSGAEVLSPVSGVFPLPEPTSFMLAGLGMIGFVARRRRS